MGTIEATDVASRHRTDVRGDDASAAFQALADRHLDAAYRLAWSILRDPTDAQDATHDAFVQAWRKWPSLRDPDRLQAWFDRILVNACRDRLRRRARWQMTDISDEVGRVYRDAQESTELDLAEAALGQLSPDHRIVVVLRFYLDLPVAEIAARLDIPTGTAHSRLHYALRQMRTILAAADGGSRP